MVKYLEASRNELFNRLDKPYLQQLPQDGYIYRRFKLCRVHTDYHIQLEKCYYSVPWRLIGKKVEVRYNRSVEICYGNRTAAVHPKLWRIGDTSTLKEHMPPNHRYAADRMNSDRLISLAEGIGKYSVRFTNAVLNVSGASPNAYRHIRAVLSMEKTYGKAELETVLGFALEKRIFATDSIRSILNKKLYLMTGADNHNTIAASAVIGNHANLRGKDNYR